MKNKFWMLLVSVVIAFALWLYVITVVSPGSKETYYNVPVVLQGEAVLEDRGLIITDGKNATITLELGGNRTDLIELNSSNITVIADLSKIYESGDLQLAYDISYPGNIASNAIEELSRSPGTISLTVEQLVSKEIPVYINWSGNVPSGYRADKAEAVLDHGTVTVEGPASVIAQITKAVMDVDIEGRTESFSESARYTLVDENGNGVDAQLVRTNVAQVTVTMMIQQTKEVPLTIAITDGGGATAETTSITMKKKDTDELITSIMVAGSASALEQLDEIVVASIDLANYMRDTEVTYQLKLPAGVDNLSNLSEIVVEIKFPDLQTTTFKVNSFQLENIPEGMDAQMVTQELTIRVRGPKELVDNMTSDSFVVSLDLTGEGLGTFTKQATVTMKSEFSEVGIIGTYSVSVTVFDPLEVIADDAAGTGTAT